ncbi:MAG: helix-turn-helix transcriptional regulator [Gammaproteobacteria bacterium]
MEHETTPSKDFPIEFQEEIIDLIRNLIEVSAVRFQLVNPQIHIKGYVSYNVDEEAEEIYQARYTHLDPLHPSRFEGTETSVICSDTMMSDEEWRQSVFYKEFMAPRHYDHDTDVFFRQDGRIIAVLSLLRDDTLGPFSEKEIDLIHHIQPFLEYSLNNIYLPKRFSERDFFLKKYALTDRELDVVEIVMAGAETKTMANELNLSLATVKTHLQHIFNKVGVHSTKELISVLFRDLNG